MLEEPSLINIEFAIKFGGGRRIDGTEQLNKRYDVAKNLLHDRYAYRIPELERHIRESHEKEVQQWSLALSNIELAVDVNE